MPRTLVRAPEHDRAKSLGWLAVAWMEYFTRHGPGDVQGLPVAHGDEYTGFGVDCYALDESGRRLYDSGFLSRPKGCDKSGYGARFALFEALGPCRFAGWAAGGEVYEDPWGLGFRYVYEAGEPVGRPVKVPYVRIMATEEGQTGNVYDTIHFNLTDDECPLAHVPGVDAGLTRVFLPGGGEITPSTAGSASKDGGKETFVVFDESHLYDLPELRRMYRTVTRNLRKRKKLAGTWFLETTTMFAPGAESIAEETYKLAEAIRTGRSKRARLMYDHRWGECEDLSHEDQLRAAILEAFGEAIEWNDLDSIVDEFYDTRADPADSRRYFLNAETSASDAWLAAHEYDACADAVKALRDGDMVTLGFDGSRSDDATGLVACRVSDGHMEPLGIWERPADLPPKAEWQVDREAVDAAVDAAMARFEVVGYYADPPHWQDYVDRWHRKYADRMQVKATVKRPLEWYTNRPTAMVAALERMREAFLERAVTFTPAADRAGEQAALATLLRRHFLNARRRPSRAGLQIAKEYPGSPNKIDGAVAATLAWEARMDAVAAGVKSRKETVYAARRIR
jgi:hypothetical protein